jgi:glyoxylase-like metal-dependent hydrolase (beta-lactamase superfamily II)
MAKSLRRLAALPDPTVILPGHEGESTIGEEKKSNPFLLSGQRN